MVATISNSSYSGGWSRRIAWTQEAAVSWDRAIALQPEQQEQDYVLKEKQRNWQITKMGTQTRERMLGQLVNYFENPLHFVLPGIKIKLR